MIGKQLIIGALAFACVGAVATAQQTPPAQPTSPRPAIQPPTPTTTAQQESTILVGCLYQEGQIPGRAPNVAERAGVLEDYILADASMPGRPPATARPGITPGATGTAGTTLSTGSTYKVENLPDERLKALVGKRVEVTGRIDPEGVGTGTPAGVSGAPSADRGPGPDEINLPEFEAASIREVSGTCPASPATPPAPAQR